MVELDALATTLLAVTAILAAILSALHALLNSADPRSALGWVLVCLGLPFGGALIYFMFGVNRINLRAAKIVRHRAGHRYRFNRRLRELRAKNQGSSTSFEAPPLPGLENMLAGNRAGAENIATGSAAASACPVDAPPDQDGQPCVPPVRPGQPVQAEWPGQVNEANPADAKNRADGAGSASPPPYPQEQAAQEQAAREQAPESESSESESPDEKMPSRELAALPEPFQALDRLGYAINQTPLFQGNSAELLENGDAAYSAMLRAIRQARHSVWLEIYIFANDVVGRLFADALAEAHERGVQVLVLVDGLGSFSVFNPIHSLLRKRGVPVALFLPPRFFPPQLFINLRNHRKLLIVDGKLAFTGGVNICQGHVRELYAAQKRKEGRFSIGKAGQWHAPGQAEQSGQPGQAGPGQSGQAGQAEQFLPVPRIYRLPFLKRFAPQEIQDLHFRLHGPVVEELQAGFLQDWNFCTNEALPLPPQPKPRMDSGPIWCRVLPDGPDNRHERLAATITGAVSCARRSVRIITPYFLPPPDLHSALASAALRGVHVEVLLPQKNDQIFVHWAAFRQMEGLMESGVRIYFQPPPFAHTKLLIIDGFYCQFGSANLDKRSLRLNFELNMEAFDPAFGQKLEDYFIRACSAAREYTLKDFHSRSLPARIRDSIFWLGTPYL